MSLQSTSKLKNERHPSQDNTNRHAIDSLLRKYGFTIHSRSGRMPVWKKNNILFSQKRALLFIPEKEVKQAIQMEVEYLSSI